MKGQKYYNFVLLNGALNYDFVDLFMSVSVLIMRRKWNFSHIKLQGELKGQT